MCVCVRDRERESVCVHTCTVKILSKGEVVNVVMDIDWVGVEGETSVFTSSEIDRSSSSKRTVKFISEKRFVSMLKISVTSG